LSIWLKARRVPPPDPPGDLDVRLVGGDREATVLELGRHACAAGRLEIA
jgi:hypothetical protein